MVQTAEKAISSLNTIRQLKREAEDQLLTLGRKAPLAKKLLDSLFQQPVISAAGLPEQPDLSAVATYRLIDDFERLGILKEMTGFKRNRLFVYDRYLAVFHE